MYAEPKNHAQMKEYLGWVRSSLWKKYL